MIAIEFAEIIADLIARHHAQPVILKWTSYLNMLASHRSTNPDRLNSEGKQTVHYHTQRRLALCDSWTVSWNNYSRLPNSRCERGPCLDS